MTRRLVRNPAVIALGVLAIVGVIVALWGIGVTVNEVGFSWSGAPTEAQLWELRLVRIANQVPGPSALAAVAAVIGILVVGSATRRSHQRATRAMMTGGPGRR